MQIRFQFLPATNLNQALLMDFSRVKNCFVYRMGLSHAIFSVPSVSSIPLSQGVCKSPLRGSLHYTYFKPHCSGLSIPAILFKALSLVIGLFKLVPCLRWLAVRFDREMEEYFDTHNPITPTAHSP